MKGHTQEQKWKFVLLYVALRNLKVSSKVDFFFLSWAVVICQFYIQIEFSGVFLLLLCFFPIFVVKCFL